MSNGISDKKDAGSQGWVIGIGASAGGLEAVSQFLTNLPKEFTGTIIVAQHLAPHAKSMMVELLAKQTPLPVVAAQNKQKIEAGTIYVAPPNYDIDLVDDHIILTIAGPETRPKPSVNEFFESLARAYGNRAVGIILSGTGSDGSEGIRAIRAAGGVTLAQDDQSAKYDGMPRSAVDTGSVDAVLPPEEMAKSLGEILNEHSIRIKANTMSGSVLHEIFELIRGQQGTDFSRYKMSTIQRRLSRRISSVHCTSLEEYLEKLKTTPGEVAQLAQELLVSVTSFFRDPEVFQALRPRLMKTLESKKTGQEFRLWVAGCATGEEAYTYAVMLAEMQEQLRKPISIKVFATDLDADAVYEARSGIYFDRDIVSVPKEYQKYFDRRDGGRVEVAKRVRDLVVFARQDLVQNPPFVKMDVISCRNVLIYFEGDLQKRILETFHYALNPSGLLVLGKSESVSVAPNLFDWSDRKIKLFEKLNVASKLTPPNRISNQVATSVETFSPKRRIEMTGSLAEAGYLRILADAGICGVIVDEALNLLQILGNVSPYMGFSSRVADLKLTNLLPKNLAIEIPLLIRKASQDQGTHQSRIHTTDDENPRSFHVLCRPLSTASKEDGPKTLYLLSFEPVRAQEQVTPGAVENSEEYPQRLAEVEHELHVTREHLQTVIQELGVSNEELQALNEELSSTNEELQASTEELETTNEELQSSNEELTTVNEELSIKSNELRLTSATLENIQNSIGIPIVVVNTRQRLIRYNSEALKVFSFNPGDIGREISKISANVEIPELERNIVLAIGQGRTSEVVCESLTSVYQMRVLPSFDEVGQITGAILTFYDNTDLMRTKERLAVGEKKIRSIIEGSPSIVSVKDNAGRYTLINEAFKNFFGLKETEVIGRTDRELFNDDFAGRQRDADLEIMLRRQNLRREEIFVGRNKRLHVFNTSRFLIGGDEHGANATAVGMIANDVTSEVEAKTALMASETRYKAIIEDQAVFVCRHLPGGKINFANTALAGYFGGSVESYIGQNFESLVDSSDRQRISREIASITPAHPVVQYDHKTTRFGNQQRWLRWIHRGIFTPDGKAIEYQAVGFDITESRIHTNQLLEKEAVYSGIFSNTLDFISVYKLVNGELYLESVNRSAEKMLGFGYAQLVGRKLEELLNPETASQTIARYNDVIKRGKPEDFEEELYLPGGVKHFSTTLVPIPNADGVVEQIAALSRDVSSYKNIERDLRRAKDAAEVANRAKSDFLASMSHELRTPLNVVLGLSELLAEAHMEPEFKGYASSINRSGKVLLSLIEDVLDISKIEAGKVQIESIPFSLSNTIAEVTDLLKNQAGSKNLKLIKNVSPEADRYVLGDPSRIRQILVNLIGNAIKFTEEGQITVDVTAEPTERTNDFVFKFRVTDTGIGIREEDHTKIFQKFSQADSGHSRRFGGTGLGLVISKQLVHLMNGEMGFKSESGKGSIFWFTVPLSITTRTDRGQRADGRDAEPAETVKLARPLKVLAIDDNRESQNVIGLFLKRLGHDYKLAGSGPEAIHALEQDLFDVVLMDIQMPLMDGYEATRRIRSMDGACSKLPIIALTANAMAGDAEKCFAAGMDDYLTKPMQINELKQTLEKWGKLLVLHADSSAPQGRSN